MARMSPANRPTSADQHRLPVPRAFSHMTLEEKRQGSVSSAKKVPKAEIKRRVANELGGSAFPARRSANRISSLAASSSASPWPAPWSTCPRCSCSTSRLALSTSNSARALQVQLKQIQRDVGITFVYVTHDQEEALTMVTGSRS